MKCSICKETGHNKRSCTFKSISNLLPTEETKSDSTEETKLNVTEETKEVVTEEIKSKDIEETKEVDNNQQVKKSRGSNCFKSGKLYQTTIYDKMKNAGLQVCEVEGAKSGPDIILYINDNKIGFEVKNKKAFEGGSQKMFYNKRTSRLEFCKETIHSRILLDMIIYEGKNLPYYEDKKTLENWKEVQDIFSKDIHIPVNDDTVSKYYLESGVYYIQIEGSGLYHTGIDILNIGVPFFECKQTLRIRTSKHIRKGIRTDVVGDINYNKKTLKKSNYDMDTDI
jgi:hypothetical protein